MLLEFTNNFMFSLIYPIKFFSICSFILLEFINDFLEFSGGPYAVEKRNQLESLLIFEGGNLKLIFSIEGLGKICVAKTFISKTSNRSIDQVRSKQIFKALKGPS